LAQELGQTFFEAAIRPTGLYGSIQRRPRVLKKSGALASVLLLGGRRLVSNDAGA